MLVVVRDVAVTPDGTDGACVSAHGLVEPVTVARDETFPWAWNASTASVYAFPQTSPDTVVPGWAVVAAEAPLTYTRYPSTPTLSLDAAHVRPMAVSVALETATLEGAEGGVVSVVDDGDGDGVGVETIATFLRSLKQVRPEPYQAHTPSR